MHSLQPPTKSGVSATGKGSPAPWSWGKVVLSTAHAFCDVGFDNYSSFSARFDLLMGNLAVEENE
jgi:hypothetical protein